MSEAANSAVRLSLSSQRQDAWRVGAGGRRLAATYRDIELAPESVMPLEEIQEGEHLGDDPVARRVSNHRPLPTLGSSRGAPP